MSRCHNKDILNNVVFAFKMSLLSERHFMTVVINIHKPYFIFKTYVMSWLWRCHASLIHTPSSKVLTNVYVCIHYHSDVFERRLLCSPRLHLFDQKYSETFNIVQYYYNLKHFITSFTPGKAVFAPVFSVIDSEVRFGVQNT